MLDAFVPNVSELDPLEGLDKVNNGCSSSDVLGLIGDTICLLS